MRRVEGPRDLPYLRESLAAGVEELPGPDAVTFPRLAGVIRRAEMYWVARDMTALALDGSHDLPEWTPDTARPEATGLLVWQGALPSITYRRRSLGLPGAAVPLRGVVWYTDRLPSGVPVITLQLLTDAVGSVSVHRPTPFAICEVITMPLHDPPVMLPDEAGPMPEAGPIMALIGATWIMMQEPKVAERATMEPSKRDAAQAERTGGSRPLVTTVDLRTLRHVSTDHDLGESGRRLTVRHVVRGHWRQQYHPSDGSRQPTFIAPYIKGPADAPLHLSEKVMVWRR